MGAPTTIGTFSPDEQAECKNLLFAASDNFFKVYQVKIEKILLHNNMPVPLKFEN